MSKEKFSFQKGWGFIAQRDTAEAKKKLMDALGINNEQSWTYRLRGDIEPKVSQAAAVEAVFAEYGVKAKDVWGTE